MRRLPPGASVLCRQTEHGSSLISLSLPWQIASPEAEDLPPEEPLDDDHHYRLKP